MNRLQAANFAAELERVATDLRDYARQLNMLADQDKLDDVVWDGSTYALAAQGAVWDQMVADGEV